ncbi:hypothetical protein BJV74DRAFT_818012 [Russula compacta]|nr:hypothetical protein BJV74DRAFT_818012 [Russula compacta]
MTPPHIISWGDNERSVSPVSTTTTSVVSIDSIPSNTSSTVPDAPRTTQSQVSFPVFLGNRAPGLHFANDDPFLRHDKYYFKDGNITFLVDGTLYCVHRYFFSRDSTYFSTRLGQLGVREHEALSIIISLGDVERNDFEALLSVLYPDDFEEHCLSYEQWKSVLHLSTRWGFASLRKLALRSIKPPTPFDQLLLARAYSVDHWVLSALSALCERTVSLSLNEARQMSIEDVVLIATVREDIRDHGLQVDSDEIPHCVEAAQAGMRALATGLGAFPREGATGEAPTSPSTSSGTEWRTRSRTAVANEDDGETAVAASPVDVRRGVSKEDDTGESGVGPPTSPVVVRHAEKPSRPSSAWGKILVVPSPTLSVPPHSPVWGTCADPLESHNPSAWRRLRVKSVRSPDPVVVPSKPIGGDQSDSDVGWV